MMTSSVHKEVTNMNIEAFIEALGKQGIILSERQLEQFEIYHRMLVEWNEKMNLTNILEKEDVYLKHFYDSLTLVKAIDLTQELTLCDVGTGAGFPGIVLKIVFPNLKITLIDSLLKRVKYLNDIIEKLELKDIEAFHYRIEDYNKLGNKFDIVTARAVANLSKLYDYCIPGVKKGGVFIAMKANATEEIEELKKKQKVNIKEIPFLLPYENAQRDLIVIRND